ncbi:MAG: AraC family transcriptional regulator [Sphingobacteriales bacterium]|nr:MAG: AraC family transcriptional regulator [Sphingobacteriales bacterium]
MLALWQRFFEEQLSGKIPGKLGEAIYCVYTDYAGDYTQDYTTLLGCSTSSPEHVPEGMMSKQIAPGNYTCFEAKGKMEEGFVLQQWKEIWQSGLDRAYTSDFEVYEPKQDNEPTVVPIFIALR